MRARFYLPSLDADGVGELDPDEATHLTRVLRLGAGDEVEVFDGRGHMHRARVLEAREGRVRVERIGDGTAAPEPAVHVTLVMSALKGDKMDDVIRDAAMIGVSAIQPVVTRHSEVTLAAIDRGRRVERWRRIAVASVKQCGRAVVPAIEPALALDAWAGQPRSAPTLVLTEPGAGGGVPLREVTRARAVHLLVGPEGGWSAEERTLLAGVGARAVALGGRTLRADAAPLVAIAGVFEAWDGW